MLLAKKHEAIELVRRTLEANPGDFGRSSIPQKRTL
jgi:hypothetical protein